MNKSILLAFLLIQTMITAQMTERSLSSEKWQFKNTKEQKWLPAKIPGTVHLDLMDNKIIPDPFKDENEKKVQWIENEDWEYQTTFKVSANELKNDHIDLIFNGLDTFSEIYLNGKLLKKTDNMFRKWNVPVKEFLKQGDNDLQIKFKSAVKQGKELAKKVPFAMPESPRSFVRKAQYQFGWDWGPRLVTAGIWKEIQLELWNFAKIENVKYHQNFSNEVLDFNFEIEINAQEAGDYRLNINQLNKTIALKKGINTIRVPYNVSGFKLWQPNGWGEANLHDFKIELSKNSKALDQKNIKVGLRTVELVQEKDAAGKSFYFKVNGQPLYAKGTNWIPADSFSPRITKEKYRKLIKDAKDAHMNMIRIWGGGIYEDDEFYKACDENGILVWQDFMFAGSFYPADEAFLNNVKEEVKDQVNRLQNHPSITLWCGNNEIDEAIVNWGYQKQFKYSKDDSLQVWKDYKKLFHEVIPNALKENLTPDKNRYWPSSPSIGWGHKESLTEGDSHYWGVWWGEQPFEIYNEKVGRFMSEYGFQGMPGLEAVKSMFSGTPDLNLQNPTIKAHEKHSRGWEIINEYIKRDYPLPVDFVKYNYISQLLQARGMRIAVEAHRRAKPFNMGTLYWQLNDCWPVVSWSSIDYSGNWKALQYQMKRSFEQQVILTEEKEGMLNFYAVNDGLNDVNRVSLKIEVLNFEGKVLKEIRGVSKEQTLGSILKFDPVEIKNVLNESDRNTIFLQLTLKDNGGKVIAANQHFFARPKDLQLSKPAIKMKRVAADEIEISTDVLAKDVYLMGDTHYSDNFFDLLPNTSKKIKLSKPLQNIEVMSLWDTMQHQ
ncbi:glycoside hydrolase family 2 protein [Chryseobacterium carnipullorum]|uniref:Beta-mannosidase B n=2 Tax=Chryseobacterium carnipullorum TaxID=1124835 RepID=A0A376E5V8_CHRCU|nr:glycoside hydrolase family 2 protein [Chryseobacterium carnipullorum]AZA50907.1 glycoside hydrolase family 2 protein [Chryseobacterium carnipullorum]STD03009.1 Exo-beta-D-glucosaminidase precursor [Chryseobacterium carnipullorum]